MDKSRYGRCSCARVVVRVEMSVPGNVVQVAVVDKNDPFVVGVAMVRCQVVLVTVLRHNFRQVPGQFFWGQFFALWLCLMVVFRFFFGFRFALLLNGARLLGEQKSRVSGNFLVLFQRGSRLGQLHFSFLKAGRLHLEAKGRERAAQRGERAAQRGEREMREIKKNKKSSAKKKK